MSDYTPTTEQVRRYWQYGANAWLAEHATDNDDGPDGSIGAEFDRWLAAHDRAVQAKAWDEGEAARAALARVTDDSMAETIAAAMQASWTPEMEHHESPTAILAAIRAVAADEAQP